MMINHAASIKKKAPMIFHWNKSPQPDAYIYISSFAPAGLCSFQTQLSMSKHRLILFIFDFLFTKDLRFSKTSKNISSLTGKLVGDPTKTTRSLLETPHKKLTVLKHGASPEFRGNAQGYI